MTAMTVTGDGARTDVRAAAGVNDVMLTIGRILIALILVSSGVAGISMCLTANSDSASTSALATAGRAPTLPASPAPLVPIGLVLVGTGLLSTSILLRLWACGIA